MDKKPYVVEIEESYHRTVIVWCESANEAETLADALCDSGDIDMERNCYAGRSTSCTGKASTQDLEDYMEYDG